MSLNIPVIYGSVRSNREGILAAGYLQRELKKRGHESSLVDPLKYPLPLLDKMYKEYGPGEAPENMQAIGTIFDQADAFLVVTGEYNHSIPPALKNILDHYQSEYLFKPSGIAAYSAGGFAGMRSAIQLRIIMGELGAPSISTLLSFPAIGSFFDADGEPVKETAQKRTDNFLKELEWYALALKRQREQSLPF